MSEKSCNFEGTDLVCTPTEVHVHEPTSKVRSRNAAHTTALLEIIYKIGYASFTSRYTPTRKQAFSSCRACYEIESIFFSK
jgi:hypothetical protein